MSVETHRVLMGTCGWKHKEWLNDFYSDDLPEEWQLGFYSNEFPVVYVPTAQWLDDSDISEWCEDVAETFRFVLEISADILNDEKQFNNALNKAKSLNELCLGFVFTVYENSTLLEQHVEKALAVAPVCVDRKDDLKLDALNSLFIEKNISQVWDGISEISENFKQGTLSICHVSDKDLDMVALRNVIEGCLEASNNEHISVLCLDGNPPSLELLRKADIILNLL